MRLLTTASTVALYALLTVAGYLALNSLFSTPTKRVQILWTLAGAIGALLTASNLYDAVKDKAALRSAGRNGDLAVMANGAIRQEAIRLTQMLTIVMIGVYVLASQPTLTAAQRRQLHIPEWTPASVAITAGLLWVVFATVFQAYADRRVRATFYRDEEDS